MVKSVFTVSKVKAKGEKKRKKEKKWGFFGEEKWFAS